MIPVQAYSDGAKKYAIFTQDALLAHVIKLDMY